MSALPSKPKRRWFQFSLRTFLVLMTVFAVWFGWAMNKAREQRKAVAWVEELGGAVWYDYQVDEDGRESTPAELPGPNSLLISGFSGSSFGSAVQAAKNCAGWKMLSFIILVRPERLGETL